MSYQEETKNYFSLVLAALIIVAIATASFVYSLLRTDPEDIDTEVIESIEYSEDENGTVNLTPSGEAVPSGPPPVHRPTLPPAPATP